MISFPSRIPAPDPFRCPELQASFDDLLQRVLRNATPEFKMCLAAGIEMETKTVGNRFIMQTVPKVAIVDMGEGFTKIFVRYADEPTQEASASRGSAGHRRRRMPKG